MKPRSESEQYREAYWDGYDAYQAGISRYENPYDDGNLSHHWNEGWVQAAWDD